MTAGCPSKTGCSSKRGYNTFAIGKWHLSPSEDNTPAGPFHRWPLGRGFERFYGFLGGQTNQWYPDLTQDNASVRPPSTPKDGYHLSEDLADQAIKVIVDSQVNAPENPFFMYYAPGAAHASHHVAKEWADRYSGAFDMGWDAYREIVFARRRQIGLISPDADLSAHDRDVPEWVSLSDDERRLYSRMMDVPAIDLSITHRRPRGSPGRARRLGCRGVCRVGGKSVADRSSMGVSREGRP
jgi:arylsulfatase A-like enzyme